MTLAHVIKRAKAKALSVLLPPPFESQWSSYSFVGSASSERGRPDADLLNVSISAVGNARHVSLSSLSGRLNEGARALIELWPGEHYRLLAAFCDVLKPKQALEVGTASGLSALAMLATLPSTSQLVTFDVLPWDYSGAQAWGGETLLREEDFTDGRFRQEVGDLSDPAVFDNHRQLIENTNLFFIDGPKDGSFERVFLKHLESVRFASPPFLIFDDIKLWNMLSIWQEIERSRLDLTSFGHWSGTGIVHWK